MEENKNIKKVFVGIPIVFLTLIGLITVAIFLTYFWVFLDPIEIQPLEDGNSEDAPLRDNNGKFETKYDLREGEDFVDFIFLQWEFKEILSEFYDYNEYVDELLRLENLDEIPGVIAEINAGRVGILQVLEDEIQNLARECGNDAFCLDHEFGLKALVSLDNVVQQQIEFYQFNEFGERDRQFYRYSADKAFSEVADYELFFEYDLLGENENLDRDDLVNLIFLANIDLNLAVKNKNLKGKCDLANEVLKNNDDFKFYCSYPNQQNLDLINRLLVAVSDEEMDIISESCELEKIVSGEESCVETREYLNSLKENLLFN